MWNPKYDTDKLFLQNRNRLLDIENKIKLPKEKGVKEG